MTTSIPVLIYFSSLKKLVKMRELFEGTAKIAILNFSKKPLFMRCSADKCSQYITGFRVRPVMTTSIPLLIFNAVQFKHYLAIIQQNRTIVKCFAANFYFFVKSSRIFKTCMQKSFQNRKIKLPYPKMRKGAYCHTNRYFYFAKTSFCIRFIKFYPFLCLFTAAIRQFF